MVCNSEKDIEEFMLDPARPLVFIKFVTVLKWTAETTEQSENSDILTMKRKAWDISFKPFTNDRILIHDVSLELERMKYWTAFCCESFTDGNVAGDEVRYLLYNQCRRKTAVMASDKEK